MFKHANRIQDLDSRETHHINKSISNTSAAITTEIMTHSTWAMPVNNTEHIFINA